jgi:hypothetical protein
VVFETRDLVLKTEKRGQASFFGFHVSMFELILAG